MAEAKQRHISSVRKLVAIMFTDIVGYTKMMSEDENVALATLRKNRDTHKKLIPEYHGQFLKEMGDGILASFENSSDAVICAAAIMKASNDIDISLRIGIHMGEVIFENNDVFGDGVNIASRIEPLAEPNQILISETVHNNVQNKPGITTNLLGERELKGVEKAKIIYQAEVHDEFLTPSTREEKKKALSPIIIAIIGFIIIITGIAGYWFGLNSQESPVEYPVIRYNIELDASLWRTGRHSLVFSPDGKFLCYVSNRQLFLKSLDEPGYGLPITGPDDPREPSFSPDGKWIVFEDTRSSSLMKVPVTGGKVQQISSLLSGTYGINWYEEGIIFFQNSALYKVNANGGIPEKIYPQGDSGIVANYIWDPQLLPDGKTILYNQRDERDQWDVRIVQIESEDEPEILIDGGSEARFLNSGYIAFMKDESLQAVRFDPSSKKIIGTPQVLTSDQILNNRQFTFNNHGTLVYFEGADNLTNQMHMVWIDFSGKTEKITNEPAMFGYPRMSQDGRQIVVDLIDGDGTMDIVIYNPVLGTATNFITEDSVLTPVWHPDNVTITYFQINEPRGVYMKPVDLSYSPKLLFETKEIVNLGNWSGDGRYLVFSESENSGNQQENIGYFDVKDSSIYYLDFINTGEHVEVFYPSLSPDSKWLSYCSDGDGNVDLLFVVPFPGPGRAHRVSIDEGHASIWAQDMKTIYFIGQNDLGYNMSRADIESSPQFSSSEPEVLFSGNFATRGGFSGIFEIHPDGDRFLMLQNVGSETDIGEDEFHLNVVVNWPELLDDR